MTLPTKTFAAALVAAAIPLYAGSATAAPLSQSLALNSADVGTVEQVQYRRWNRGRWIGPAAAGFAAGAIVGGALARVTTTATTPMAQLRAATTPTVRRRVMLALRATVDGTPFMGTGPQ